MILQIKTYEPKISYMGCKHFHVRGQKEKQIFFIYLETHSTELLPFVIGRQNVFFCIPDDS